MRMRTAAIWCAVLLGLGAGYVLTSGRNAPPPGQATVRLLDADPGSITDIRVKWAEGAAVMTRDARAGGWIASGLLPEFAGAAWPVADGRVPALLRLLGETRAPVSAGAESAPGATTLELLAGARTAAAIDFSPRVLGGQSEARLHAGDTSTGVMIPGDLAGLVRAGNLRAWVDTAALGEAGRSAERVSIRSDAGRTVLQRGAAWSVIEPAVAPADADAVRGLLNRLAGLTFVPESATETTTGAGVLTIDAELARRTWDGQSSRRDLLVRRMEVLGPAGVDGSRVRVRLSGWWRAEGADEVRLLGPVHGTIDAAGVNAIPTRAEAYASRVPSPVPAGEIRFVAITRAGEDAPAVLATRSVEGWTVTRGEPIADVDVVTDLVGWLTASPDGEVLFAEPAEVRWAGVISLGPGAESAHDVRIGVVRTEAGARVCAAQGTRWIVMRAERPPRVLDVVLGASALD